MTVDKLTRLERIRLAQSVISNPSLDSQTIMNRAQEFEDFILKANKENRE